MLLSVTWSSRAGFSLPCANCLRLPQLECWRLKILSVTLMKKPCVIFYWTSTHCPLPDPPDDALLPGEPEPVTQIMFQRITPELIRKLGREMHGSSGPSGMDSDSWCRMLTCYKTASNRLCSVLAAAARSLCIESFEPDSMVGFTSARLISLNK